MLWQIIYTYRVKELQEMKNALNIFMTKIKLRSAAMTAVLMLKGGVTATNCT